MADKMVFFTSGKNCFEERIIKYKFFPGFAISQKQKSISSLHDEIRNAFHDKRVLEISTKSPDDIGVRLSAFNLRFCYEEDLMSCVENAFQSSKVFEHGGPYRDLLDVSPKQAKRDERLFSSGNLIGFEMNGKMWPLEPKTFFYDWIYVTGLKENIDLAKQLLEYDVFTDIEFNHKKSLNCQARSAAIFVSLYRQGILEEKTSSPESFKTIYSLEAEQSEQLTMF